MREFGRESWFPDSKVITALRSCVVPQVLLEWWGGGRGRGRRACGSPPSTMHTISKKVVSPVSVLSIEVTFIPYSLNIY